MQRGGTQNFIMRISAYFVMRISVAFEIHHYCRFVCQFQKKNQKKSHILLYISESNNDSSKTDKFEY